MKKLYLFLLGAAVFAGANAADFSVYNNGTLGENIKYYWWWNCDYNQAASDPTGASDKVISFKATDGGSDASFGLNLEAPGNTGSLHSANLTFKWYAEGTGTYLIKLNAGQDYEQEYTFATVTSANSGSWQTATINIPQTFPSVAKAWDDNSNRGTGYVFSAVLSGGKSGDVIYFKDIKYTDIDTTWEAPAPPTPDVTYPDGTVFAIWPSATGDDIVNIDSNFYFWGGGTSAEMTEDGQSFIRFTSTGDTWFGGGYLTKPSFNLTTITEGNYDLVFDVRLSSAEIDFRVKVTCGNSESEKSFGVGAIGEWVPMRINLKDNFGPQMASYAYGDEVYIFSPVANKVGGGALTSGCYLDFRNVRVEPYKAPEPVAAGTSYYGSVAVSSPAECTFDYKAVVNENQTVTFYVNIPGRDALPGAATPSLSVDGDWKDLVASEDSEYAWERTTENSYVRGQMLPCFFYQPYTGEAIRADFNYSFGSSNEKPEGPGPDQPDQPGGEPGAQWSGSTTATLNDCQINGATKSITVKFDYVITYNANKTLTVELSSDNPEYGQVTGIVPQLFLNDAYEGNFETAANGYIYTTTKTFEAGTKLFNNAIYSAYAGGSAMSEKFDYTVGSENPTTGIETVESDRPARWYGINGIEVRADRLTPGLYIRVEGGKATKVIVR